MYPQVLSQEEERNRDYLIGITRQKGNFCMVAQLWSLRNGLVHNGEEHNQWLKDGVVDQFLKLQWVFKFRKCRLDPEVEGSPSLFRNS